MIIFSESLEFEWDKGNRDKIFKKHKLSAREIEKVFLNEKEKFIFDDQKHSATEKRYGIYGEIDDGKLLSIVFTLRGNKIRVIAARRMSRKERRSYEKFKANSNI